MTFAATYQEVRKALQAHRIGRDQKYATIHGKGKGAQKGKDKGKGKSRKPFQKGQSPRKPKKNIKTVFNKYWRLSVSKCYIFTPLGLVS